MISIESLYHGIRSEGVNFGLPMTFVRLGEGNPYPSVETAVEEIWRASASNWICILGEETLRVGVGSLVAGLSTLGLRVELEYSEGGLIPGWASRNVDRLIVNYLENTKANYFNLRAADMIRFSIGSTEDLRAVEKGLAVVKKSEATKYILLGVPDLLGSCFEVVRHYSRTRLYWEGGEDAITGSTS